MDGFVTITRADMGHNGPDNLICLLVEGPDETYTAEAIMSSNEARGVIVELEAMIKTTRCKSR